MPWHKEGDQPSEYRNGIACGHSKDDRVADIYTCAVLEYVCPLADRSEDMSVT
jgi:hypothetical protein